ncbi:Telomerase reverse transcriptase [Rhizina undulata]
MVHKRKPKKRKASDDGQRAQKRVCYEKNQFVPYPPLTSNAYHLVLSPFFNTLVTLRKYMFPFHEASKQYFIDRRGGPELLSLLDTTLVGVTQQPTREVSTHDVPPPPPTSYQTEIVDVVIKSLFNRSLVSGKVRDRVYRGKPNNVLTQGYLLGASGVPELIHANSALTALSSPLWNKLLELVGERAMLDLLRDTSVFLLVNCQNGINNYNQVADALNRYTNPNQREHATKILCYIFPRQFKLHNVFTSAIDRKEVSQPVKDYASRRKEIAALEEPGKPLDVPKRLNGRAIEIVARMQRLHKRCSYHGLLEHYCPDSSGRQQYENLTDYASKIGEVLGFAKAVICRVIPNEFWGNGNHNRDIILRNVDTFIRLRRYESLTLHEIMQGLRLTDFAWLAPVNSPNFNPTAKLSLGDANKRKELLAEFIYWLFDSFLMPLLSSHFYITESNRHQNRLFYFRHDVWKRLSEPALERLQLEMFEALPAEEAKKILGHRILGHAQARLLPKKAGVRLIMNLRRKGTAFNKFTKKPFLTPSINIALAPVLSALSWEKKANPALLGSSLFSVGDMYLKLKTFQAHLQSHNLQNKKLYFAKVDIRGCFDSIPQDELIKLIDSVLNENQYLITKFSALRPPPGWKTAVTIGGPRGFELKPIRKFLPEGKSIAAWKPFDQRLENELAVGRRNNIFVDGVVNKVMDKEVLMNLLKQHIRENIVKIGDLFFRQKRGIPQGSILSTILCNFFYADMEKTKLPFTTDEDGVLLRLTDDFLFITLSPEKATQFIEIIHAGNPEYGAFVQVEKSLVNFNVSVGGRKVERLYGSKNFPYCGNLINTRNLNVSKDRQKRVWSNLDDSLTIEYCKGSGIALHQKTMNYFSLQVQPVFFDTNLNTFSTVAKNIYYNFVETAMKFHRGIKALSRRRRPRQEFMKRVINDALEAACTILGNIHKEGFACAIGAQGIRRLGALAFRKILRRKQAGYREVLEWLDGRVRKKGSSDAVVSRFGPDPFEGLRY